MYWVLALSLLGTNNADLTRDTGREQQPSSIAPTLAEGIRGIPPDRLGNGARQLAEGIRGIPPDRVEAGNPLAEGIRGIPPDRLGNRTRQLAEGIRGIPPDLV